MRRGHVGVGLVPVVLLLLCNVAMVCLAGCDEDEVHSFLFLDHSKHKSLNMACESCHAGAREEVQAGIPSVRKCAFCHVAERSYPPLPPELAKYVASGQEIPWTRITRLAGHVRFPHAAHVKVGKMDCTECHGVIEERVNPVAKSWVKPLVMKGCLSCHREKQISVDCLTCHK